MRRALKPILSFLLFAGAALAGDKAPPVAVAPELAEPASFSLLWENDLAGQTDSNYTNGLRVAWLSQARRQQELPLWAAWISRTLPSADLANTRYQYGVSLTQQIFTPRDIDVPSLLLDDRPYAGWLALGFTLHAREENRLQSLELSLGLVGPHSYAEDAQRAVHGVTGTSPPKGWDNQLRDEFTANLFYTSRWRVAGAAGGPWNWDLTPRLGASLGNVLTDFNTGATFRFGYRLPDDFAETRITGAGYHSTAGPERFSAYAFVGAEGRLVLHNIFLDGNTVSESHSVAKEYLVAEAYGGLGLRWQDWTLSYTQLFRSPEFREQDDPLTYGALAIGCTF